MSESELDAIQSLFERGDIMEAAAAIRELRHRADRENDFQLVAEVDGMVSQMRSYLGGPELRRFDSRLSGTPVGREIKPPSRPAQQGPVLSLGRVSLSMIVGWLCCLFIIVGAFGPWAETVFGQSASGIDGHNDGWIMLVAAIAAAILIASFVHDPDRKARIFRSFVVLAIGVGLAAVGIYDWSDASTRFGSTHGLVSVGWGLELDTIASVGLALIGLVMLGRKPRGVRAGTERFEGRLSQRPGH